MTGPGFAVSRYATDAAAAEALVRRAAPAIVIAPGTARVRRALPGVAGRVDGRIDTGIGTIRVDGGRVTAERWVYRQRIRTTVAKRARRRENALYLVFKIVERLAGSWRTLNGGATIMALLLAGARFEDGVLVEHPAPREEVPMAA